MKSSKTFILFNTEFLRKKKKKYSRNQYCFMISVLQLRNKNYFVALCLICAVLVMSVHYFDNGLINYFCLCQVRMFGYNRLKNFLRVHILFKEDVGYHHLKLFTACKRIVNFYQVVCLNKTYLSYECEK